MTRLLCRLLSHRWAYLTPHATGNVTRLCIRCGTTEWPT